MLMNAILLIFYAGILDISVFVKITELLHFVSSCPYMVQCLLFLEIFFSGNEFNKERKDLCSQERSLDIWSLKMTSG